MTPKCFPCDAGVIEITNATATGRRVIPWGINKECFLDHKTSVEYVSGTISCDISRIRVSPYPSCMKGVQRFGNE